MSRRHRLRVDPAYFDALANDKPFEVRRNDRGFQRGDMLVLAEWGDLPCPKGCCHGPARYSGREMVAEITYVYTGDPRFGGLEPGYVVLGLERLEPRTVVET